MTQLTEPVRLEHHVLEAHLDALLRVADGIGKAGADATAAGLDNLDEYVTRHLLPHIRAEDEVVYPLLDRLIAGGEATAMLRRDHQEIIGLADRFRDLRRCFRDEPAAPATVRDLRRTLYSLHALVSLHMAKEDECVAPILDKKLTPAGIEFLARRMHEATLRAD